jgi:hypothetical protein
MLKVADREWMSFPVNATGLDRGALLRAAAADAGFAADFKDVALSGCAVRVLRRVAGEGPTAEEAAAVESLEMTRTLDGLAGVTPTGGRVWVRVELPGTLCW